MFYDIENIALFVPLCTLIWFRWEAESSKSDQLHVMPSICPTVRPSVRHQDSSCVEVKQCCYVGLVQLALHYLLWLGQYERTDLRARGEGVSHNLHDISERAS